MMIKTLSKRLCAVSLCVIMALLAFNGWLTPVTQRLGTGALHRQNDEYLNKTFNKALVGFGIMSGVKAGLAIIEGSTAGVSAGATVNLQIGDAVQSVYDYVDIAWRTLLTGCITILSIQYLLRAADLASGYVLGFMLIILGASLVLRWWGKRFIRARDVLRDILSVSIVASLAIFYILPLSVWGASHLSRIITQPQIEEAQSGFQETKETLFPEDAESSDGFFSRMKQMPERVQQIATYLKDKSARMATWTIKLIAGYIFDCIVFPITLFVLLLWLTRSVMKYIFHKNIQSSLREDIERILVARRSDIDRT